jgi:hypothetical protein
MKVVASLFVALTSLLVAGRANAEPTGRAHAEPTGRANAEPAGSDRVPRAFRLEVRKNPCFTGETLREALAVALRKDPIDAGAGPRLVVEVLAGTRLARAHWRALDPRGEVTRERTVTTIRGCEGLLGDVALSIAIAYETNAQPAPPAVGCDAACRAEIRAELRAERCREHPRSCDVDIIPVLMAGGALSLGLTADPGGGAWLGGEVRFGPVFSAALEGRIFFPSRVVTTAGDPFEMTQVTLGLVPCARYKYLLGCLSVDLGMFVTGGVYDPPGQLPIVATFGVGPRIAGQFPITDRFGIRVFADLRFAPIPTQLYFLDSPATWESNLVSAALGAGFTFE